MTTPKEAAKQLIDHLPGQASWDGIMCEQGLKGSDPFDPLRGDME